MKASSEISLTWCDLSVCRVHPWRGCADDWRLWPESPPELGVFSVKARLRSGLSPLPAPQPLSTLQCLGQISMEMPQRAGPVRADKIDLQARGQRPVTLLQPGQPRHISQNHTGQLDHNLTILPSTLHLRPGIVLGEILRDDCRDLSLSFIAYFVP